MKKIFYLTFLFAIILTVKTYSQQSCQTAQQFCTGTTYNFPASVNNGQGETGPDYGCLSTTPNPAWYYLKVAQGGDFSIDLKSIPQRDVDFICWGPFYDLTNPCGNSPSLLTNGGNEGSHWAAANPHPANMGGYPSGNTVDCSYNSSYQEWCFIPNTLPDQYYIILITNYSNQACNIIFNQTNVGQPNAGVGYCGYAATVNGTVYFDLNNNQIKDPNEYGAENIVVGGTTCMFHSMTNNTGYYQGHVCSTPDNFYAYINIPYFSVNPLSYTVTADASNLDFAISISDTISDLSLDITQHMPAVVGFDYPVTLTVTNEGTVDNNCGLLTLTYDTLFTYILSNPPADSVVNNTLYWNNICLGIFQSQTFNVIFGSDTTTTLGSPYTFQGNINVTIPDTNLFNNTVSITDTFAGSYDPNDKQVSPLGEIDNAFAATEPEFIYTVRFQNTGTFAATNIRVLDSLSQWLNPTTFRKIASSHPCTISMSGNGIMNFMFNNIMLPDSSTDEAGSHGFIKYAVKCRPQLQNGGQVFNTAYIYFDYNLPIVTNTVETFTKDDVTNIPNKKKSDKLFTINPNPAIDFVNVSLNDINNSINLIEIFDVQGKLIKNIIPKTKNFEMQILVNELQSGTYMISINGKQENYRTTFIKQ